LLTHASITVSSCLLTSPTEEVFAYADFSALIKEMMGQMLESALDGELEEQLGYSKYDYRNKPVNNRNRSATMV